MLLLKTVGKKKFWEANSGIDTGDDFRFQMKHKYEDFIQIL